MQLTANNLALLFGTPVVRVELPDGATLNAELRKLILAREKSQPSARHSNMGGWQSTWDMQSWGGKPAGRLLEFAFDCTAQLTVDRASNRLTRPAWKTIMWANVNRAGHGNQHHVHPGAFWSGVYWVDDGGIPASKDLGGELDFMDPRGASPAMYAPQLGFSTPGGLSLGANEMLKPQAGMMVLFPSWLSHGVRPYLGKETRISVAFNLSL
jgi:uncharacterized protein (TIGR02466 family)